jgi:RNA polymerase sigma-54 factor
MNKRKAEIQFRPELRQYILPTLTYYLKLIELPNLELGTYLRQELETNPLIEEKLEESSSETEEVEIEVEDSEKSDDQKEMDDTALLELFPDDVNISHGSRDRQFDPLDNVPAQGDKLYDYLMRQARGVFKDKDLEIAEVVISNIEEDGYLAATPEEIAQEGYDLNDVQRIIKTIQLFDPIGCAWRDVKESLLIQLGALGCDEDSPECILVRDYLKDLKSNHPRDIIKKLNIDERRFLKAKETIMKLDPKPGWRYSNITSRYVSPDFIVRWHDNKICAHLNDESTPRIRIRRQYREILRHSAGVPKEELAFVREKVQSAQNLIIAIEQRKKTLTRILNNLLEYQREFFEKGYEHLKPITMTEFAKQLGVNPSTISRALANKYIESPWGIHKLKFFFTAAVGHTDKRIILQKIKEIVDGEDKITPLSDTQIVKKLSRQGIIISRRTVSKYRDILRIPAHQFRRA